MAVKPRPIVIDDLLELIGAIDRRVPRLARDGEAEIMHEAAALRRRALTRIAEIEAGAQLTPGEDRP